MTWKKRCVSLIVCFALIVSITVVRPPKVEAIAFEAGIAVPIILAVAIASGITFLSEGMTESGLTEYIGQQLQSYATDLGTTVSEWWENIGGISKRDDGKLLISSPAYQAVQNFLSWLRDSVGLSDGSSVQVYNVEGLTVASSSMRYRSELEAAGVTLFHCEKGSHYRIDLGSCYITLSANPSRTQSIIRTFYDSLGESHDLGYSDCKPAYSGATAVPDYYICQNANGHFYLGQVYTTDVAQYLAYDLNAWDSSLDSFIPQSASSLSVSQTASYDALELQDDESVALDLGATVEAGATLEDILEEYLAKIVDNTATAAQEVTTDSGEGEGEGDDDDTAPYLPFIPRIWEKLQGLPDDIANKVHDLFVPSAAFVEALPAEFADVFDSRCGLLTYPAALLADFLTRLATLTAQEPVLRWGNIKEPFSDRQLIAAGSYNLNSAIQTDAMQTVYNVYMICVKAAVAFWFVELCKRKYEKIIRS